MVIIRKGRIRDCKDLLTVYQTTRWFYRTKEGGYQTVEEVKNEHKGICFRNWGWFVAEEEGSVVGEIVFRIEKNPVIGKVGIIRNLDVDVRNQKQGIGTLLTRTAETVFKEKKVPRVVSLTPPEAYNYWMKIDYFARGSILEISTTPSRIKTPLIKGLRLKQLKDIQKVPPTLNFSNIAIPGKMCELLDMIVTKGHKGRVYELYQKNRVVGAGVIVKLDATTGAFAVDITTRDDDHLKAIAAKVLSAVKVLRIKKVKGMIPKDQLARFKKTARWSVDESRLIPVTRIL